MHIGVAAERTGVKHRFRMAEHSELHMVRDWGDAWRALVRPWLEAPAGLRRDFVLVPTRGQAQALKLRCVREGVPLLGVEFLTPGLAREKWRALAPPARPALGRELLLLHLRTLLAERQARLQPEDAAWGLWQSLLSDPAGALEAYDDLLTISTSLVEVSKVTCRFHYAITRDEEGGRSVLLVKGFTSHACVNRQGKLTPFPAAAMEKITALLGKGTDQEMKG